MTEAFKRSIILGRVMPEENPHQEKLYHSKDYYALWNNYQVTLHTPHPFAPEHDVIDVTLTRGDGQKYWANFITKTFLDSLFEKNKQTGECAGGTYFRMPNMIVVERITELTVRRTIDDLIHNLEIEECFTPRKEDH